MFLFPQFFNSGFVPHSPFPSQTPPTATFKQSGRNAFAASPTGQSAVSNGTRHTPPHIAEMLACSSFGANWGDKVGFVTLSIGREQRTFPKQAVPTAHGGSPLLHVIIDEVVHLSFASSKLVAQ